MICACSESMKIRSYILIGFRVNDTPVVSGVSSGKIADAWSDRFAMVHHYTVSRNIGIRLSEAATYGLSANILKRRRHIITHLSRTFLSAIWRARANVCVRIEPSTFVFFFQTWCINDRLHKKINIKRRL